jgi:GT2 family glycosyltransferase
MTEWDHRDSRQVDQVIGAFFLVRRSLFESLEGFDERFFVYFEEVDFSYRASQLGWSSFYLAEAQAHHREHGTTEQVKALRMFYSLRSRIQYVQKHFRKPASIGLTLATLLAEPFPRLLFTMWARPPRELLDVIGGYAMLWSNVPQLLRPKHHEGDRTCASSS